jgi:hypothetical protein
MSWKDQRESIIKDYPNCRKCGEKTTNINSDLIIIAVDTQNGKTNNSFYSEHKQCKPIVKTFTKIKEK